MTIQLYDQTTFSDPARQTHGDCFRATVCTVLQVDPATLPHPIAFSGEWNLGFHKAIRKLGWQIRTTAYCSQWTAAQDWHTEYPYRFVIPRVVLAAGMSPRGFRHSVVWDRIAERMIHDPHPSRAGLLAVDEIDFLMPLAPSPEVVE